LLRLLELSALKFISGLDVGGGNQRIADTRFADGALIPNLAAFRLLELSALKFISGLAA
jgi:hypothetical protein